MVKICGSFCLRVWILASLCALYASASPQQATLSGTAAIPEARLLQPADLVAILQSSSGEKPLILQVGSHVFYAEAHIPGSEYAGAAGQVSGLEELRDHVKDLARNRFIVIYCGCCPWNKCPNIRAAYQQLVSMGFSNVKALYIQENFGADWVAKGYPVAKGR